MKTTLWKPCDLENTEKTEQILSKDPVEINWFQNGGNFLDPEIPKKQAQKVTSTVILSIVFPNYE